MPGCQLLQDGGSHSLAALAQKVGLSGGSAGGMRTGGTHSDSFMGGKKHRSRKVRRSNKKAKKSKKAKKAKKAKTSRKTRKSRKSRR